MVYIYLLICDEMQKGGDEIQELKHEQFELTQKSRIIFASFYRDDGWGILYVFLYFQTGVCMAVKRYLQHLFIVSGWLPLMAQAQLPDWGDYPALPKLSQGTAVDDKYSFLESLSDPQVRTWMRRQTDFTNTVLARISGRDAMLKRLKLLQGTEYGSTTLTEIRGMQFFVLSAADGRQRLMMRNAATSAERLLYLADVGQSISFFSASPDASVVGLGIVKTDMAGTQRPVLRLVKTSDASVLKDNLTGNANDIKDLGWKSDSSAVYYRKSPLKQNADKGAIWQHALGSKPEADVAVIGPGVSKSRKFSASDVVMLKSNGSSGYMLAEVQHGSAQDRSLYVIRQEQLKAAASPWIRLASPSDKIRSAWLSGDQLFVLSTKKSTSGAILKLDLKTPQLNAAKEVLPASSDELLDMAVARNGLYVHAAENGYSKLMRVSLGGENVGKNEELSLPHQGRISQLNADPENDGALFVLEAANAAPLSYRAFAGGQVKNVEVFRSPQIGFHRISSRNLSISRPGSNKPLAVTLLYPQGMDLDGKHPCLLTLETGTGLAKLARFDALRLAWLEQDAVMAIIYLPADEQKKRATSDGVDELLLAADYLVTEGYTSPGKLVAQESGAGKQLIARAVSRRPELFAAVQSAGVMSEFLSDKSKKAPLKNKTISEGYPYLNLKDGINYPATLLSARFAVGEAPVWMSSKFTARLQAGNANKSRPALFRTDFANGWKLDPLAEQADNWSFLLWQTGQKGFAIRP